MAKSKTKKKVKPKKRKVTKRKKPLSSLVRVREITVRYGGVIRTGPYENKRLSYEMVADCPRKVNPDSVCDYLEALVANQFYQAQLQAIESLPDEMRDEIGDFSRMSPQQAAQAISDYFKNFRKPMTPEQKKTRIEQIGTELKQLALSIKAEDKRLRKIKTIEGKDLTARSAMVDRRKTLKDELKHLRRK